MVILFSDRNSNAEKEITDILTFVGADHISDKKVCFNKGVFTFISAHKKTELKLNKGIAVFCDNTERFNGQTFPLGLIGICEENNINALEQFQKSNIAIISCGMNSKNTITLSSLGEYTILVSLQRSITDIKGNIVYPTDFKINLTKHYSPFAIMVSVAILLFYGITPKEF